MKSFFSSRRRLSIKARGSRNRVRVRHDIVGLFTVAAALLLITGIAFLTVPLHRALATSSENVTGWAWDSKGGWVSMNDTNVNSGGGSYGVYYDGIAKTLTGFAWSPNSGWMCFGSTCATQCPGLTPAGTSPTATVDASGNVSGWAKFCNLGALGWVSLNCSNMAGECAAAGNYKVNINLSTGVFTGWGWEGLGTTPNGWGWLSFNCSNNAGECAATTGPNWLSGYRVQIGAVEDFNINAALCQDGADNDVPANDLTDCQDPKCKFHEPVCPAVETNCSLLGRSNCCSNGTDDDYDGLLDCADSDCASATVCQPENCTNGVDDNGNALIDCDDPQCSTAPSCTAAWLQSKYGNIFANAGVQGNPAPSTQNNATFCITSAGNVQNFTSSIGCVEPVSAPQTTLPIAPGGYISTLGHIDVVGILAGRYGQVVNISSATQLPSDLAGKVYVYTDLTCASPFLLPAKSFNNAIGSGARGSGTLVIKGCDIRVTGNTTYQAGGATSYLRNLASLGVLVLGQYNGSNQYVKGGNFYIDPSVSQVVGTIYAEKAIWTGSTGASSTDIQLKVFGAIVSKQIHLQRQWIAPNQPAEDIEFDGRAVVNPPPGFQDIAKSLPGLTDKY
jgi:hypothetical protein